MGRTNPPLAAPVLFSFALAAAFAIAADGGPVALAAWFQAATGPRFYPDDPVWVDDDRAFDASKEMATATRDIYAFAEHTFMDPTFVYAYPTEVSPLSRANDVDVFLTDRFEFFVAGRELANGFSELNDAEDQAARFRAQVERKDAGDDEAMYYDADYVRALEYGMPPTAGLGVGIDRLVMFFTDAPSIRDVLLFPHMRPENL